MYGAQLHTWKMCHTFLCVQFWGLVEVFNYIPENHMCKMGVSDVGLVKPIFAYAILGDIPGNCTCENG